MSKMKMKSFMIPKVNKIMVKKPNFMFILIDDLGWRDLTCYGSSFYETPNLDELASEGMRFTNAYAACPVCSPTRASILTGKYPATLGLTQFIGGNTEGKLIEPSYIDHLPLNEKSLASVLQEHGYSTWHVGKWHLGGADYYPEKHGFSVNIGGCEWGLPYYGYFGPWRIPTLDEVPEKRKYLTDHLTDEAIKLIQNSNGKPFYLNLWYYSVHVPIQAKREHIKRFREKALRMGLKDVNPFEVGENFPCAHKKEYFIKRRVIQSDPKYAAMIFSIDENIGRLVKALKSAGKRDDTIIIFYSDNGGLSTAEGSPTCNAPLSEGKGWTFEGGTRVPLIINWPQHIKPGMESNTPITSTDFYPTILELANIPLIPEQHCDGISFLPVLEAKENFKRGPMYWHFPHYGNQGGTPGSSIILDNYKLIRFYEDNHLELYNLKDDISEKNNLALKEPERTNLLNKTLKDWLMKVKARLPINK
jgi:arylsulfatase A-like enzyme